MCARTSRARVSVDFVPLQSSHADVLLGGSSGHHECTRVSEYCIVHFRCSVIALHARLTRPEWVGSPACGRCGRVMRLVAREPQSPGARRSEILTFECDCGHVTTARSL